MRDGLGGGGCLADVAGKRGGGREGPYATGKGGVNVDFNATLPDDVVAHGAATDPSRPEDVVAAHGVEADPSGGPDSAYKAAVSLSKAVETLDATHGAVAGPVSTPPEAGGPNRSGRRPSLILQGRKRLAGAERGGGLSIGRTDD